MGSLIDKSGRRKYLNAAERLAFFKAVSQLTDMKARAFCLTLFYTGCRPSEALNLTADSVDTADGTLIFATLKQRNKGDDNRVFRMLPVPKDFIALLERIILEGNTSDGGRLFDFSRTTGWRIIKRVMAAAGISGIQATSKGLRHGFALACVSANVPIKSVQKFLGHKSLQNTMIYLDILGEEEREFVERTWPK